MQLELLQAMAIEAADIEKSRYGADESVLYQEPEQFEVDVTKEENMVGSGGPSRRKSPTARRSPGASRSPRDTMVGLKEAKASGS